MRGDTAPTLASSEVSACTRWSRRHAELAVTPARGRGSAGVTFTLSPSSMNSKIFFIFVS